MVSKKNYNVLFKIKGRKLKIDNILIEKYKNMKETHFLERKKFFCRSAIDMNNIAFINVQLLKGIAHYDCS